MTASSETPQAPIVYQGQFGPFTIEAADRREVIRYRVGLAIAAACFTAGTFFLLGYGPQGWVLTTLDGLYLVFWLGLGLSLFNIHIYLQPLHRLLQGFWLMGGLASLAIAVAFPAPLVLTAYQQPLSLGGIGFTFAALTGIFFKEAFCFNQLETKFLTLLVPGILLGHLFHGIPAAWGEVLLVFWAAGFSSFALRKACQPIPPDIGDKSVFQYLQQQRSASSTT